MLRILKFLFFLVIVLSGLALHLRNDQPVLFDYYLGSVELPFSLFLILALCTGALLGIAASLPTLMKLSKEKAGLVMRVKLSEKELNNLRVIPVKN
jgi:putative membrane protein